MQQIEYHKKSAEKRIKAKPKSSSWKISTNISRTINQTDQVLAEKLKTSYKNMINIDMKPIYFLKGKIFINIQRKENFKKNC